MINPFINNIFLIISKTKMQTDEQTNHTLKPSNSSSKKKKKLIKSISEKFIEEYCVKISAKHRPQRTKTSHKSSVSPSLIKNVNNHSQLSNISTCSTSNNKKSKIAQRNRNKLSTQLISANIQSSGCIKYYSSALNLTKYNNNTNIGISNLGNNINPPKTQINVVKKSKKKFLNKITSDFLEIHEELNESTQKSQGVKIKKNKVRNQIFKTKRNIGQNDYQTESSIIKTTNKLNPFKKEHSNSRNLKDGDLLNIINNSVTLNNITNQNNSQEQSTHPKKHIRLNVSMDDIKCSNRNFQDISINKDDLSEHYHTNNFNNNLSLSVKGPYKDTYSYIINIRNVDTPEELHFAFVNMKQQEKIVYQRINNKLIGNDSGNITTNGNSSSSVKIGFKRHFNNNSNNANFSIRREDNNLYYI